MKKITDFIKHIFRTVPRAKPKKLWCFYEEPYRKGISATALVASVIFTIVTLVFLIGGSVYIVMAAFAIVIAILFYGLLIAIGGSGLLGFGSDSGWLGVITTVITFAIAFALFDNFASGVNHFIGDVFSAAEGVFISLSQPIQFVWGFLQANWLAVILVVLAPVLFVLFVAGLTFFATYSLQFIEKGFLKYQGVGLICPVCSEKTEPARYSCPNCGKKHEVDLFPNQYGILKHACVNCGTAMPTMLLQGRNNKLEKVCKNCDHPISKVVGKDKHIAFVGGRHSGKTCLLVQATKFLLDAVPDSQIPEADQKEAYEDLLGMMERGDVPPMTQKKQIYRAFQIEYPGKKLPYHIHFYDIAGENFEHTFDTAQYPFYKNLNAIAFVFDPFSKKRFRSKKINSALRDTKYSVQPPEEVLDSLTQALDKFNTRKEIKKIKFNILLVKSDLNYLSLSSFDEKTRNKEIEDFLMETLEADAFIHKAKQLFKEVNFFLVSALGRSPQIHDNKPFVPLQLNEAFETICHRLNVKL